MTGWGGGFSFCLTSIMRGTGPQPCPGLQLPSPPQPLYKARKTMYLWLRPSPGQDMEKQGDRTRVLVCLERHLALEESSMRGLLCLKRQKVSSQQRDSVSTGSRVCLRKPRPAKCLGQRPLSSHSATHESLNTMSDHCWYPGMRGH